MKTSKDGTTKRTKPLRLLEQTKQFRKDWKRLSDTGRYDMVALKEVMLLLLANNGPLPPEWRDHALTGDWAGYRECHVGGDFLLIYQITTDGPDETVIFVRAGTHSELFE